MLLIVIFLYSINFHYVVSKQTGVTKLTFDFFLNSLFLNSYCTFRREILEAQESVQHPMWGPESLYSNRCDCEHNKMDDSFM